MECHIGVFATSNRLSAAFEVLCTLHEAQSANFYADPSQEFNKKETTFNKKETHELQTKKVCHERTKER